MKKNFPFLVLLAVFLLMPSSTRAYFLEEGLKYGVGARPMGMGGAFSSISDDINAIYYNPAGLSDQIFGYMVTDADADDRNYCSNGHNALNLGSLGVSQFKAKTNDGEKFDITTVAMGNEGPWGLSWGISYKNVGWMDATSESKAWSGDVGLLLHLTPELNIGIVGQDILRSRDLPAPSTGRYGFSYMPFGRALTLALDAETGRTGKFGDFTQYGAEIVVTDGLTIRAGSNRGWGTFGATLGFPVFRVHYAYLSQETLKEAEAAEAVHMLSFEIAATPPRKRPNSVIKPKEFALLDINGSLVGGRSEFSIFGGTSTGSDSLIATLRTAARDPGINGVLVRISGFEGGLGSMGIVQELRSELMRVKKAGKSVVVYIDSSAVGDEYYLASVADVIVAPNGASIGGLGRSVAISRATELMKTIGIEWQIIKEGKYKDTFNTFSPALTKDQRDMMASIVSDMYRQMINDISADRGIDIEKLKSIADGRLFTASKALELKLIDRIGYMKDAEEACRKASGSNADVRLVDEEDLKAPDEEYFIPWPHKIAVVEVDGDIVTGRSGANILLGGTYVGGDTVTEQIKRASDDFFVKAIILRVNSPGGSPVASAQIYDELMKARKKGKVVVASIGNIAASGGYFVSAAADKIVADPGSLTGSIGVIGSLPVLTEFYKKIGIKTEVIKEGEHSDMFSTLRKLSPEELRSLQELSEDTYMEFKKAVAKGREMTVEEVEKVAQGRVYTGSQALGKKLVDKLGGFSDAVDLARDLSNIPGEPKLVFYKHGGGIMGGLMEISEKLGLSGGLFQRSRTEMIEYRLPY